MTEITILEMDEKVKFYSVKETADLLNVSVPTINRWIKANQISISRFGKAVYIAETEIINLQQQCVQGINIIARKKCNG